MNAGGAPNTCKSNGTHPRVEASGERLSNTWRTRPLLRDSLGKPWVIPDDPAGPHGPAGKAQTGGDGSAAHQVDGGVTAVSYTHLDVYKRQVVAWELPGGAASARREDRTCAMKCGRRGDGGS